ncbi:MAG: hypothetical protein ABIF82_10290 [Planctomycetota bacterium]
MIATSLATGLMEEILSKSFEDPQGSSGSFGTEEAGRANYDDVDDYDNLNVQPPQDSQGNSLTDYAAFRTRVTVENVSSSSPGGTAVSDGTTSFKRVAVTVEWNNGNSLVRLKGLSSKFGEDSHQYRLTFIERQGTKNGEDVKFNVRNDSGSDFYVSHVKVTWGTPEAYYEEIEVKITGGSDYKEVWNNKEYNDLRMGSGGVAMLNQGKVVLIPSGATMEIEVKGFKDSRTGKGGKGDDVDMSGVTLQMEIWASPKRYQPVTIPPE